jgi:hypothetical protein
MVLSDEPRPHPGNAWLSLSQYVVPKLLDVYQELLGLRFQLDTALSKAAWAPGVEAYKVGGRGG